MLTIKIIYCKLKISASRKSSNGAGIERRMRLEDLEF
jgi:hypothetical protein